ncbi:MAG: glycosyltransferase family 4 protein [Chthoniobacteraceae bacterium]
MKILFCSHAFYPQIGGIESISEGLAAEFARQGHQVRLVTPDAGPDKPEWNFEVFRQPSRGELVELCRWCDVVFQNNISLQTAWPLLLVGRPWVVAHQTWIARTDGTLNWQDHLKRWLIRFAWNAAISQEIADRLPVPCTLVPNPYRDDLFRRLPDAKRGKDLVFVGRLVSDKGADLLLEALALLKWRGLTPGLTLVGGGPEEQRLREQARELGLAVDFTGPKTGEDLVRILNAHRILVVPSRWAEPFGIVALEGIACGCAVIGSRDGGLADAIGPCGLTFPNNDVTALADAIDRLCRKPEATAALLSDSEAHLARHTACTVASAYLNLFQSAAR